MIKEAGKVVLKGADLGLVGAAVYGVAQKGPDVFESVLDKGFDQDAAVISAVCMTYILGRFMIFGNDRNKVRDNFEHPENRAGRRVVRGVGRVGRLPGLLVASTRNVFESQFNSYSGVSDNLEPLDASRSTEESAGMETETVLYHASGNGRGEAVRNPGPKRRGSKGRTGKKR